MCNSSTDIISYDSCNLENCGGHYVSQVVRPISGVLSAPGHIYTQFKIRHRSNSLETHLSSDSTSCHLRLLPLSVIWRWSRDAGGRKWETRTQRSVTNHMIVLTCERGLSLRKQSKSTTQSSRPFVCWGWTGFVTRIFQKNKRVQQYQQCWSVVDDAN